MSTDLHPWQRVTAGSNLMLQAAADLRLEPSRLQAEYARLDALVPADARTFYGAEPDGGWTALPLLNSGRSAAAPPVPLPALGLLPLVHPVFDRFAGTLLRASIMRQAAGSRLGWHFDNQALHRSEMRLLIPIVVPAGAGTWIGHEWVAWPAGQAWTGDFCLPHQVENPTVEDRIVLALDLTVTDALRRLFPAALSEETNRRLRLAEVACNLLTAWRTGLT
jgi:hypothetical protein